MECYSAKHTVGKVIPHMNQALEKLKMTFSSRPPDRRKILQDLESKCIVATKQHRGVHKDALHQLQNTNSLNVTRNNTRHLVFEGELAINFTSKMSRLRLAKMETPRQDQFTMRRIHRPDLLTTKALALLGSMYHAPLPNDLILAKSLLIKRGVYTKSCHFG